MVEIAGGSFRGLVVWKQAMRLAKDCYFVTKAFPKEELYGLTSQLRRASVSVPANIAEGSGRGSRKDYQQFLRIALGSLREVETYVLLCLDIELVSQEQSEVLIQQVGSISRLLRALIRSLDPKPTDP